MHPDALFDAAVYEVYVNGVFWDGLREDDSFMSLLAELKARRAELLRQLGLQAE